MLRLLCCSLTFTQFPEYLRENESTISAEDKARYLEQQQIIKEVVELFEKPGYNEAVEMPTISDLMGRVRVDRNSIFVSPT